jgi:hypothetical protein
MTQTDLGTCAIEDLEAGAVHLEDLEIFVGQRSRMHPGPGWALALAMVRRDLADVRTELAIRSVSGRFEARAR